MACLFMILQTHGKQPVKIHDPDIYIDHQVDYLDYLLYYGIKRTETFKNLESKLHKPE